MSSGRTSFSSSRTRFDSQVYTSFGKVMCACGDLAVLRKARTVQNNGKLFWGCQHFKGHTNVGCGFFEWFYDDSRDCKEESLRNLQWKIEMQFKELEEAQKELTEAKSMVEVLKVNNLQLDEALKNTRKWKMIWKSLCFIVLFVLVVKVL